MSHAQEAIRLRDIGFHPIIERPNSKMPVETAWQKLVDRPRSTLRAVFDSAPEGHGIGTVTHGFIVIDLDIRPDKDGARELLRVEAEHGALPRTLTSLTPSGGKHLFYRVPPGVEVRNSVSKLGPGIDIRGTGGQVVLPPTVIDGRSYRWDESAPDTMADLPSSWLKLLSDQPAPAAPAPQRTVVVRSFDDQLHEAGRRARYMATVQEPSIQGAGGNQVMMKAAFHAKEMSRNTGEALSALLEWNTRCARPEWSEAELLRALSNSEATWGAGLDREKAPPASAPSAPSAPQGPTGDLAWVEEMQSYVSRDRKTGTWNLNNPLSERGAVMALVSRGMSAKEAKDALKDCSVVLALRVDCDPSKPQTFEQDGQLVLNNYVPPRVRPQAGKFPVLDEVLSFLTAGDPAAKHWLMNWMAFAVQNPARPMRTVPVIYGAQRTGKSLLSRVMQALIGEANCATVRNEDIKGKFTSHFVSKLFVAVGEIEAGEVTHATSTLKYLTGEPTLVHEAKGSAAFYVPNRIKMLCTSNQTLPVALEGEGDTRWVLFKQLERPAPDYSARMDGLFDKSNNEWNAKGMAELQALLAHLLAFPVDVVLARSVHVNDARASAVEASRSSIEQFVDAVRTSSLDAVWMAHVPDYERAGGAGYENMDFAEAPSLTGAGALYATYRAFCKTSGLQALGMGRFPGEIERHAAEWRRHKASSSIAPTRPWVYTGIPRERHLRTQYLPLSMRQGAFDLGGKKKEEPKVQKDDGAKERALAAVQQTFGLNDTEEEGTDEDVF